MSKKRCAKCRTVKQADEFAKHKGQPDGLQIWCRKCHGEIRRARYRAAHPLPPPRSPEEAKRIKQEQRKRARLAASKVRAENADAMRQSKRDWRIKNQERVRKYRRDYYRQHTEKVNAHNAVLNAVREGRLVPQPCTVCGSEKFIDGHHDDYSKPLVVRWLCRAHHKAFHIAEREAM